MQYYLMAILTYPVTYPITYSLIFTQNILVIAMFNIVAPFFITVVTTFLSIPILSMDFPNSLCCFVIREAFFFGYFPIQSSPYIFLLNLVSYVFYVYMRYGFRFRNASKNTSHVSKKKSSISLENGFITINPLLNECVICFLPIKNNFAVLDCNHYYHCDCISEWIKINKSCPVCRKDTNLIYV